MKYSIAVVFLLVALVQSSPRLLQSDENSAGQVISKHPGYNVIPIYEITNSPPVQGICSPHCFKEVFEKPVNLVRKPLTSEKPEILYLANGLKSVKLSDKLFEEEDQVVGIVFTKYDFPFEKYPDLFGSESPEQQTAERNLAIPYLVIGNENLLQEINHNDKYEKVAEMEVSREGLVTKVNVMLRPNVMGDTNKSSSNRLDAEHKNEAQQTIKSLLLNPNNIPNLSPSSQTPTFVSINDLQDLQTNQFSPFYSNYKLPESIIPFYPYNLQKLYPPSLYTDSYTDSFSPSQFNAYRSSAERPIDQTPIINYPTPFPAIQNPSYPPSPSEYDYSQHQFNYPMTTEYSFPYGSYSQMSGYPSSQSVPHRPQKPYHYPRLPGSNTYKPNYQEHYYPTGSSLRRPYDNEPINKKVADRLTTIILSVIDPVTLIMPSFSPSLHISENDKPHLSENDTKLILTNMIHQLISSLDLPIKSKNITSPSSQSMVSKQPVSDQQHLTNDNHISQLKFLDGLNFKTVNPEKPICPPCKCSESVTKTESHLGEGFNFGNLPPPNSIPGGYSSALQP